jgi:hypothetical protein
VHGSTGKLSMLVFSQHEAGCVHPIQLDQLYAFVLGGRPDGCPSASWSLLTS